MLIFQRDEGEDEGLWRLFVDLTGTPPVKSVSAPIEKPRKGGAVSEDSEASYILRQVTLSGSFAWVDKDDMHANGQPGIIQVQAASKFPTCHLPSYVSKERWYYEVELISGGSEEIKLPELFQKDGLRLDGVAHPVCLAAM